MRDIGERGMTREAVDKDDSSRLLIPTSLELPLVREGETLRIDLGDLPIFFGLSILSRDVGEKIINRYHLDRIDMEVEKRVKLAETPELAALQVEYIKVTGDYEVFEPILTDKDAFFDEVTTVFGSLQMRRWRKHIYPANPKAASKALVFLFRRSSQAGPDEYRVILDRVRSSKKPDKFFLRARYERLDRKRLDLTSFPHVVVENPEGRTFIAGATRISSMLCEQVRWQAKLGKRTYSEVRRTDSFVFGRLADAGFDQLDAIQLSWTEDYVERFRGMEPDQLSAVFKKILLLMEDHTLRRLLRDGETIRADFGDMHCHLDLSQLGRAFWVSFGHRRRTLDMGEYLHRMPALEEVVAGRAADRPLKGVKVLLIHHVTAEILGFIAALRKLGAESVHTLFVHYGESVPSDFLEALLDLDQDRFRCHCLNNVEDPLSVEGYFVLSPKFSGIGNMRDLDERLHRKRSGYMQAMVETATRMFLEMLLRTAREGGRCLIIEDGGYLTPQLNRKAMADSTLQELLDENGLSVPGVASETAGLRLTEALDRWVIGTVEHTKNGLDRLEAVLKEATGLARPCFSIAVSNLKVTEEASEVAASILSAIESVLHAQGRVLSMRKPVVIGARGSIGRHLVSQMDTRCRPSNPSPCLEVDLRANELPAGRRGQVFATRFQDLPRRLALHVDLVIGVTGRPAFRWEDMEMLLAEGSASSYYLVSGSTKTIEFESVSSWLEHLLKVRNPTLRGIPFRIEGEEINDPQTGRLLGQTYRLIFKKASTEGGTERKKEIRFLGNLMPINFLYYGVPGEVMGTVLSQLLRCSLGLVERVESGRLTGKSVWAVDRDIDVDGQPLSGQTDEPAPVSRIENP
jgi:hypothetical protein